ncbi:MAG: hypothetical protein HGA45_08235 [Chloroflexales bacterium]|nr:hypothetical protein [Chloroflexales bacterium]
MSDDTAALVPSEVKTVDFYGDTIAGALVRAEGVDRIYVPAKPICDYLGVDWSAQRQRILRDPVLAEGMVVIPMPSARGPQPTACLPLDLIPGFLFGISTGRVTKPEVQEKLNRYRRECFRILWEAFRPDIITAEDWAPAPGVSGAQLAYEIATAVQHLARQQLELEQRLNAAGRWAKGIEERVEVLELSIGPRSPIDDEQAAALAAAVRAVGHALEQRGVGDYRGVYGQLYARFGITSYKNLQREKYEQALAWLQEWHREITEEATRTESTDPS